MHSYRGRSGPSKATPSNVQCQKCLKRDKQSLFQTSCSLLTAQNATTHMNARLGPKSAHTSPGHLAHSSCSIPSCSLSSQARLPMLWRRSKLQVSPCASLPSNMRCRKGVADEELAKREAERTRKREREMDEDAALRDPSPSRRRRSVSYDSISSISTRSPSPAPRRSRSPQRRVKQRDSRSPSPRGSLGRGRSYDSGHRYSRGPSESPERGYPARGSRAPRSPSPRPSLSPRRERGAREPRRYGSPDPHVRGRDSYARHTHSASRSRSPVRREVRGDGRGARGYRDRDDYSPPRRNSPPAPPPRQPSPPRERSLIPFSKRLALTQTMNQGR